MLRHLILSSLVVLVAVTGAWAQETDVKGGQDHPLLSRMPGFYLYSCDVKDFDRYETVTASGEEGRWEGKVTRLGYAVKTGAKPVSMMQIARNYENAVKKIGGIILFSEDRVVNAKIPEPNGVTYVHAEAYNEGTQYELVIVEPKPMEQEVIADAAALAASITSTGKTVVYGIFFDTGKSLIKPESKPTLDEITKLLQQNPRLALYVVGHTDNAGTLEYNLKLSADRADAVVKALIGNGIESARLKAAGVGPYCPVASNKAEEGKAKNRRVELVERN